MQVLVQYLETPIDRPREGVVIVGKDHFENAYSHISFNVHDKVLELLLSLLLRINFLALFLGATYI